MRRTYFGLVFALLVSLPPVPDAAAQPRATSPEQLGRYIDEYLKHPAYENAIWAALVVDLASGETVYQRHPRTSLLPASTAKLFTTAAALDRLGPGYTFQTDVYADGPLVDGTIEGNVYVRGVGDPTIGGRFADDDVTAPFRAWAEELKQQGIRAIAGDLVGDDDFFDETPFAPGWSWDDEPFDYAAEIGALSFNDNTVWAIMTAEAPGRPARLRWEPFDTPYVRFENVSLVVPADSSKDEDIKKERAGNTFRVATALPAGRIDTTALAVANPTRYFVHVLRDVLSRQGIAVRGEAVDVDDRPVKPDYTRPEFTRLLRHVSPPLAEIVAEINKESQNLYAELVLRTLGVLFPTDDPDIDAGSTEMGLEAAMATYARAGVDTSRIQLVDGSGLSRMNLVSAQMTARLLSYMWHHPDRAVRDAFIASLPIAGVDGTLERRLRNGGAARNARAKSGTFTGTANLSGYVASGAGTPLLFVLMCNNHTRRTREVNRTIDAVVQLLARYAR